MIGMPTFNVNSVDWDELYRGEASYAPGSPGWNIGELQPEIAELERQGLFRSPVLDSGCGVGETTLSLAAKGYETVGLDLSAAAIDLAKQTARERNLTAQFAVADLTRTTGYENFFNTIIDGLVFHCLPDELRHPYMNSMTSALKPGGTFVALVFAVEAFPTDIDFGPNPFTERELRAVVGDHLIVDDIWPARAWVNVPAALPAGFEYRDVIIGSDGHVQLPSWIVTAHRKPT